MLDPIHQRGNALPARRALDVYWNTVLVGQFREVSYGVATFAYESGYDRFPISVSMPVQQEPHEGPKVFNFLANLIPESEHILADLTRVHRVEPTDTFGLLIELGHECAGALILADPEEPIDFGPRGYEPIEPQTIRAWQATIKDRPTLLSSRRKIRLSIAGAQAKGALYFDPDGQPFEPLGSAATSHLVKPPITGCRPNTAFVEWYSMQVAQQVLGEAAVPGSDIWERMYRVERFDRVIDPDSGRINRLHQEDLCQALGLSKAVKYEEKAKPEVSFVAQIGQLLDKLDENQLIESLARERERFVQRLIINILLGNADAHLKNFGLLYTADNLIQIAPLYDVVCTAVIEYPVATGHHEPDDIAYTGMDTEMAIKIGDCSEITEVARDNWDDAAHQLGVKPSVFHSTIEQLGGMITDALIPTRDALLTEVPHAEIAIETSRVAIEKQCHRLRAAARRPAPAPTAR